MKNKFYKKNATEYKLAEVVSVVSHQLKTPLSAMKGYLEVLLSEELGKLTKQQKEYLNDILENNRRMMNLVRDFLDVVRIESGQIEFMRKPTDLAKITKEVLEDFSLLAKAKNCNLFLKILEKPPLLNVDPVRIKEAIANIVSNAILYNKRKGKIELSLFQKGEKVLLCCKDTGIGIAEREKDKIFTKFYRSEQAVSLAPKGSGLGLFISKALIEKNGGKLWFKSREDKGSIFCFSLPIKS